MTDFAFFLEQLFHNVIVHSGQIPTVKSELVFIRHREESNGSAVDMLLHTAQAPALTMQLIYVSVLLAAVVIVVDAERVRNSPHRKADGATTEHVIDVARPRDHQIEEKQKDGKETVGELIRSKPRL